MAYQITSESYGRRLPKITAIATSTDDLATLGTDWAEGSTCVIGSTTYSLDKVQGWVEPGSGGGGGGLVIGAQESGTRVTLGKTWAEISAAFSAAQACVVLWPGEDEDSVYYSVVGCEHWGSTYAVIVWNSGSAVEMSASGPDEYPSKSFD